MAKLADLDYNVEWHAYMHLRLRTLDAMAATPGTDYWRYVWERVLYWRGKSKWYKLLNMGLFPVRGEENGIFDTERGDQ